MIQFGLQDDTICALSTPEGRGALSLIRITGDEAIEIMNKVFSKQLTYEQSHITIFGHIKRGNEIVDEVVVALFSKGKSFTGEYVIEITCHGSTYIVREIIQLLIDNGCRMAQPGEFTLRAFANGNLDLSQAEAVADLIASNNQTSHRLAIQQLKGGVSNEISEMRKSLINFASLIELELDFSEEDVEFADRSELENLVDSIQEACSKLANSFRLGNAIKSGIPVAIVGEPNVGKSTLLNSLLGEEKAIVSNVPGTTRDVIEDQLIIEGIEFRFIDTAGIRDTHDVVESLGIERTYNKIDEASIILYVVDSETADREKIQHRLAKLQERMDDQDKSLIMVVNKIDLSVGWQALQEKFQQDYQTVFISARSGLHLDKLKSGLLNTLDLDLLTSGQAIITNARHYESLVQTGEMLTRVKDGLNHGLTGDLIALDIRQALNYLGEITGDISVDDLLGNIFSNFCIGK